MNPQSKNDAVASKDPAATDEQDAIARWVAEGGAGTDPARPPPRSFRESRRRYRARAAASLAGVGAVMGAAFWLHRAARHHVRSLRS